MAIFNVAAQTIQPGAERHSAAVDPPAQVTALLVTLADPNGVWNSTAGNVLRWGVQASRADGTYANDGTDWNNQGCVFQDNLPFGSRDRAGGLPSLLIRSTDADGNPVPVAQAGVKLRLAIRVDHVIVLGATVATNADAA